MDTAAQSVYPGGLRILAVEDHPTVRRALGDLLKLLGHEPIFATGVQAALGVAREDHFELLLCDICLPDGDGWELLRHLKAADCCPPRAVAMSCLTSPADFARSEAAGFCAHLGKPFTVEQLEAVLLVPGRVVG